MGRWCANLVTAVLRCRTSFAAFVRHAITLPRACKSSVSPAFPLPVPFVGIFAKMPSKLSPLKQAEVHFQRAVTVIVLALNFWWSGGHFVEDTALMRVPSSAQRTIYGRISDLLQVDGPSMDFCLSKSGRRVPQLVARLSELSEAFTSLGVQSAAYEKTFEGREVAPKNEVLEQLEPYRSLDSSRLKLHGSGHWDPTDYLSDLLAVPFRNPDVLLFDRDMTGVAVPKITDPMPEVAKVAKLWDSLGLLHLHSFDIATHCPHELVKIFNCYKSTSVDRQIGDRRGRNAVEARLEGPGHNLPTGFDLLDLAVSLPSEALAVSVTDRRDFYHQFQSTQTRAVSNTLGPGLPWHMVSETKAFNQFLLRNAKTKQDRLASGDFLGGLGGRFPVVKWDKSQKVFASFASVLQGDHGGVEYACDSHCNYLQSRGLLQPGSRVVADEPFLGDRLLEGLVIDDYFAVAVTSRTTEVESADMACFKVAREAYEDQKLLGSPDKDVISQRKAKVVGAQIDSSERALSRGLCTIGSPPEKRYSLSWITLLLCQLSMTTDVLHVCLVGAWVSVLMFRRPLMSVLNKAFRLVNASEVDASSPRLVRLPRAVVTELTLLAVLCPLAVSDLAAVFHPEVFCTDASLEKGAICSAPIESSLARTLWRSSRSKGAFHRLLPPAEALARRLSMTDEIPEDIPEPIRRPLAFHYDFLEVFAGAAVVSAAMALQGFVVGPPIDLSSSPEFNMEFAHVIAWLTFLVSSKRVKSFLVSPPCTSFSIMRRPALRSKHVPFGFNVDFSQTRIGNLLAHRGFQLLRVGLVNEVPGIFETPFTALLRHLPGFKSFLGKPAVEMCRCDSCMFQSIHQKSFRFLTVHLSTDRLSKRCDKSHSHVVIEGSYTKDSATYVPLLASALAQTLADGIRALKTKADDLKDVSVKGHESQLVNSVALTSKWEVVSSWNFKREAHINILEMSALERLAVHLASKQQSLRVTNLVDSFVCSAASSKGRTSSLGLAPPLRRFCAVSVAAFLFFCTPFVPTRLNASDDPTRDVQIRSPSGVFTFSGWSQSDLGRLVGLPRLRRWASNWVRLVLSLCGPAPLYLSDRGLFRQSFLAHGSVKVPRSTCLPANTVDRSAFDFDASLGYPGEGPRLDCRPRFRLPVVLVPCGLLFCWLLLLGLPPLWLLLLLSPSSSVARRVVVVLAMVSMPIAGGALLPRTNADNVRAGQRASRPALQPGRPVLPNTVLQREVLFRSFSGWCRNIGVDIDVLLLHAMRNLDEINAILLRFGRELYEAGRPYGHFAETINSVSARRPAIRRHLQACWDLAYAWVRAEPPIHHTAMPFQVLLASVSVSLIWGWPRFAGVLALTWGGVMRIGETIKAKRRDLLLPCDFDPGQQCALLAVSEAKTRFSAARHQTVKLDAPDLVRVVSLAFCNLAPDDPLWPFSGSTLRNRFRAVLTGLKLPSKPQGSCRPLDLGSLRAGGATWILSVTEDGELVRRRGRWISQKVMEIYLQETSAIRFIMSLTDEQRLAVMSSAHSFTAVLTQAELMTGAQIQPSLWYKLYCNL